MLTATRSSRRLMAVTPTRLTLVVGTPAALATLCRKAVCTPFASLLKSATVTLTSEKLTEIVRK